MGYIAAPRVDVADGRAFLWPYLSRLERRSGQSLSTRSASRHTQLQQHFPERSTTAYAARRKLVHGTPSRTVLGPVLSEPRSTLLEGGTTFQRPKVLGRPPHVVLAGTPTLGPKLSSQGNPSRIPRQPTSSQFAAATATANNSHSTYALAVLRACAAGSAPPNTPSCVLGNVRPVTTPYTSCVPRPDL